MRPGLRPGAEEFASSFWIPFRGMAIVLLVLTPILVVTIDNPNRTWIHPPLAFLAGLAVASLPLPYLVWAFRVDTDAAGVGGYNGWGLHRRLRWNQIAKVRKLAVMPGVCYLRVTPSKGGPVIWLPVFLRDPEGFQKVVASHTPEDHPLRMFFDQRPNR